MDGKNYWKHSHSNLVVAVVTIVNNSNNIVVRKKPRLPPPPNIPHATTTPPRTRPRLPLPRNIYDDNNERHGFNNNSERRYCNNNNSRVSMMPSDDWDIDYRFKRTGEIITIIILLLRRVVDPGDARVGPRRVGGVGPGPVPVGLRPPLRMPPLLLLLRQSYLPNQPLCIMPISVALLPWGQQLQKRPPRGPPWLYPKTTRIVRTPHNPIEP